MRLEDTIEKAGNLFTLRGSLSDHSNFWRIKNAYLGFLQAETSRTHIPLQLLNQLNFADHIALYEGIQLSKGQGHDQEAGSPFSIEYGTPFGELCATLIHQGYRDPKRGNAQNVIRLVEKHKVGEHSHSRGHPFIEERLSSLEEDAKIEFLHAFFSPRGVSQEFDKQNYTLFDEVYERHKKYGRDQRGVDSNQARQDYVRTFINLLEEKKKQEEVQDPDSKGWIVPSSSRPEREYFVQALLNGEEWTYFCSCKHGFNRTHGLPHLLKGDACKHINYVKAQE